MKGRMMNHYFIVSLTLLLLAQFYDQRIYKSQRSRKISKSSLIHKPTNNVHSNRKIRFQQSFNREFKPKAFKHLKHSLHSGISRSHKKRPTTKRSKSVSKRSKHNHLTEHKSKKQRSASLRKTHHNKGKYRNHSYRLKRKLAGVTGLPGMPEFPDVTSKFDILYQGPLVKMDLGEGVAYGDEKKIADYKKNDNGKESGGEKNSF